MDTCREVYKLVNKNTQYPFKQAMWRGRLQGNRLTSAAVCLAKSHRTNSTLFAPTHFCRRLYPASSCIARIFSFYKYIIHYKFFKAHCTINWLLLVSVVKDLRVFAPQSLDLPEKRQILFEFSVWWSLILYGHANSTTKHSQIETLGSLSPPLFLNLTLLVRDWHD